jgi:DNA-binding XRE family transcriptional regulator
VGEIRPLHTSVFFEGKAAAASALGVRNEVQSVTPDTAVLSPRKIRERFGFTQAEMAWALDVGLRTIQNQERNGRLAKPRGMRDLAELATILEKSFGERDRLPWLHSKNDGFGGERPVDLVLAGRARDIIGEFRRLQAGEPI